MNVCAARASLCSMLCVRVPLCTLEEGESTLLKVNAIIKKKKKGLESRSIFGQTELMSGQVGWFQNFKIKVFFQCVLNQAP